MIQEPISITPALARRIEIWPVGLLVPYQRNARTHSPEQVAQIAASIVEFGFNAPILVDSNAGIIAGHGRLLAARKSGLAEVPVVVLDHLSETQRRAYIIADNKLALNAGWDEATLAAELREIEATNSTLSLVGSRTTSCRHCWLVATTRKRRVRLRRKFPRPRPSRFPAGGHLVNRTRPLICGDCRDLSVLQKLMAGARANVVITSPPYAITALATMTSQFDGAVRLQAPLKVRDHRLGYALNSWQLSGTAF